MRNIFFAIATISILAFSGCMKNKAINKVTGPNLIANSSFEYNGQISFTDWTGSDTSVYRFVNDVPVGGGYWSLQLSPCWMPCEGYAEASVTGLTGTHNYVFNCYTKAYSWTGKITISKQTATGITNLQTISFSNQAWGLQNINLYNITLSSTDKLIVHLSAGSTEVSNGRVLFDKIVLQQQ